MIVFQLSFSSRLRERIFWVSSARVIAPSPQSEPPEDLATTVPIAGRPRVGSGRDQAPNVDALGSLANPRGRPGGPFSRARPCPRPASPIRAPDNAAIPHTP